METEIENELSEILNMSTSQVQWTSAQTKFLIKNRLEMEKDFSSEKKKKSFLWMIILRRMKEGMLSDELSDFNKRLEVKLSSIFKNMMVEIEKVVESKVNETESSKYNLHGISKSFNTIESKLNDLQRLEKLNDVIILGVPLSKDENPTQIVNAIAMKTGCQLSQSVRVRRANKKSNKKSNKISSKKDPPIIVHFASRNDAFRFLDSCRAFGAVKLSDIGFSSDIKIFIGEGLSALSNNIRQAAFRRKEALHIDKIFTRNGLVFIKLKDSKNLMLIRSISQLDAIATTMNHKDKST